MSLSVLLIAWIATPLLLAGLNRIFSPYAWPLSIAMIAVTCETLALILLPDANGDYRFSTTLALIYRDETALLNHAHQLGRLSSGYFLLAGMTAFVSWLGQGPTRHLAALGFLLCHLGYAFPTLQPILVQDRTTFANMEVPSAFALANLLSFFSGAAVVLGLALLMMLMLIVLIQTLLRRKI